MLLITGATGFVGSHLVEELAMRSIAVRALVRRPLSNSVQFPNVETVLGDLASGTGLEQALEGVDQVIHLAGTTKALKRTGYFEGNVRAAENLAKASRGRVTRFVHVSSLAAAGPGAGLREEDEPRPVSCYGRSKLEGEQVVRKALPDAVIVRPPVVYGPRDTDVFQIIKSAAHGISLEIAGATRQFSAIYVKDLVRGLLAALESTVANGREYYFAHAQPFIWGELAATAARIMGRPAPRVIRAPYGLAYLIGAGAEFWAQCTRRPGIISRDKVAEAKYPAWTCDPGRAAREMGFTAATSLEAGLRETIAWYKEAGWLKY